MNNIVLYSKKYIKKVINICAWFLSLFLNHFVINAFIYFSNRVYYFAKSKEFKKIGKASFFEFPIVIKNGKAITIGDNFDARSRLRIEAFFKYEGDVYKPLIEIGNSVGMNFDCHLACINKIVIEDNVLIGSNVLITDHAHGKVDLSTITIPPKKRQLFSKGPVIIKRNVWIGEFVQILPGVTIGENSIIGSGSIVTKDIPSNVLACGNPARIIRHL